MAESPQKPEAPPMRTVRAVLGVPFVVFMLARLRPPSPASYPPAPARSGVLGAGPRQDRHGGLGQVVVDQVLQAGDRQQLRRGDGGIAPEAGGAADAHGACSIGCAVCGVHACAAPSTFTSKLPARACP